MQKLALASVDEVEEQWNDGYSRTAISSAPNLPSTRFRLMMLSLDELAVTIAALPLSTEPRSPNN